LADTSKTTVKVKTDIANKNFKSGYKEIDKEVHKLQVLDPATGTGTFLAEVIKHVHKKFKGQTGIWSSYAENDLLPRLNGFELLMASYAMAHLKIDLLLKETGFKATKNQRTKIYLTNSLEEYHPDTGTLFANWLSNEANEANHIKRDTPVMCIIGNPPYSGESNNKGNWIMELMQDYKKEPGGKEKLKEKNSKWINDDYVKFLRYGQHFIEKNGTGVLAFINPHGFLDNPTFRGMRWNLLKTYDKIYTIDLHGNSKKKETAPDGSADVNVFDIMQGVSINIFVKTGKKKANELGKIFHYDLFGKRDFKYDFLSDRSLKKIDFIELTNRAPDYFMVQKDFEAQEKYQKGASLSKLFKLNNVGIVTSRDGFVIDEDKNVLINRIEVFFELEKEELLNNYKLRENKTWKIEDVKTKAKEFLLEKLEIISYRPFDKRYIYNDENFIERSRNDVMQHFKNDNLGIVYKLGNSEENSASAIISRNIIDFRSWSRPGMQGGDYIAPLYKYTEKTNQQTTEVTPERTPNLNLDIVKEITNKIALTFTNEKEQTPNTFAPIDILDYIYAVLHSPSYRDKYKEFLKIDFPRIPYPKDQTTFWKLVKLGKEIREIHLLESETVENYITSYPETGDNIITRKLTKNNIGYEAITDTLGKVWINDTQYFDNVPLLAWEFYIGGYQPAQKWLKDRKERELKFEDILHYQKIIVALTETDRIMKEIDKIEIE